MADVRVTVTALTPARLPAGTEDVTTQALGSAGNPVSRFRRFSAVRLTNPNHYPVHVRVSYLVYDKPPEGQSQQVTSLTPTGDLTEVPADGHTDLTVPSDAATAVDRYSNGPAVSIKAYFSQ
ncbi:hypothetical protein [Streptomyces sp. CBMA152]|uniref:hypothetical protein n=1 Tax=Streptomyces sp. CBMA152 TaxID=1896312 RepID=UPI001660971D|nr:hypothetical protein [Streptomyces sp. CBMA152]MBD0743097.1 hypothetical protein [Streptomyces sp. CBMA152]